MHTMRLLRYFVSFTLLMTDLSANTIDSDLGRGNEKVKATFEAHLNHNEVCKPKTNHPRVLLTGFGLFKNVSFNISGVLADNFIHQPPYQLEGKILESHFGAKSQTQVLEVAGQMIEVCSLVLDVSWDLSAALTIKYAESFRPDFILMMGRGDSPYTAIFENGALNLTHSLGGFGPNGEYLGDKNLPISKKILPETLSPPGEVSFTWNPQEIEKDLNDKIASISKRLSIMFPENARSTNRYICNNISYLVQYAVSEKPLSLAGGLIEWVPLLKPGTKAGFLHLPQHGISSSSLSSSRSQREIANWIELLKLIISHELSN